MKITETNQLEELSADQLQEISGGTKDIFDLMDELSAWIQDLIKHHT